MKKKFLAFACALTMLSSGVPALAAEGVKVFVNNYEVVFQGQQPVILNGRTLVPLRGVMEAMEVEVVWNAKDKSVFLKRGDREATFWVGKKTFKGGRTIMEEPVQMINGSVMIPLRVVVGYFDGNLTWDATEKTASITIAEKEDGYSTVTYNKEAKGEDGEVLIQTSARYPQLNEAVFGSNAKGINEKVSAWAKKSLEVYLSEHKDKVQTEAREKGEKFVRWEYSLLFSTPYYDENLFSFCVMARTREGAEDEKWNTIGSTYDLKTGARKSLSDVVTLPANTTEQQYMKNIVKADIEKNPPKYLENAEKILEETAVLDFYMAGPKKLMVFVTEEGMITPEAAGIAAVEKSLP